MNKIAHRRYNLTIRKRSPGHPYPLHRLAHAQTALLSDAQGRPVRTGRLSEILCLPCQVRACRARESAAKAARQGTTIGVNSDAELCARLRQLLQRLPGAVSQEAAPLISIYTGSRSHKQPLVGVIMGSDSDLLVMLPAAHILDRFQIPYKLTIVSARRTDGWRSSVARTLRVGGGHVAHLKGKLIEVADQTENARFSIRPTLYRIYVAS